ncbi:MULTISPECIES: undecaprenyl-phosphate glucose phosphotransferase [unclassified Paenibacillus]|uniref:undecaprenyl-phosphate glucose phosphotransferase n=1 Tax=unclassified Paenibacillus TaxID=185978 RepID=UPI001AE5A25B|nr:MULTISPECIES: undecaprenyl-phosphate glucose phosphotransferase [unclassified Paenibacillus]MBP1157453.1 Undecaprenyl-phosphate glucose phosphotransferase [Paenibacillus sp. PvP091]MBP1171809.1 Undecaprenyl-phosphate glucose phosphotransferase [Paenibacillus sp. PvR098]MBP2438190.1 Undecaprenyl-phosphate glucose phosphotransferase [Paenibacillus sp. PvP052]
MIRRSQGFLSQIYSLADFVCIQLMFLFSWWLKFESGWIPYENPLPIQTYALWSLVYGGVAIFLSYFVNFYTPKRKKRFSYELFTIIQVYTISLLILLSFLFIFKELDISRSYLLLFLVNTILAISFYRYVLKFSLKHFREKGFNRQFVLILGAGSIGKKFYKNLLQYPELGYEVVGFLDDYHELHEPAYKHYKPILGRVDELEPMLSTVTIDEVIIALPLDAHHKYGKIINVCEKAGVKTLIIPDYFDYLPSRPYFDNFAGMPLINVRDIPLDEFRNRFLKRTFDIVFSLIAIMLTLPLLIVITVGIKLTSPGPIIFKQERVGFNRRNFMMYKFRSMKIQTEKSSDTEWTVENDPRKTKFGSFLRKTSLDELPQFFNVLFGHMSVVGPRPERPYFVEQFKEEIPKYMVKHHIRPGITGWAQSNGLRGDTSIEDRIKHDIFYIENWTFLFDIKIILKTIINGFINKNAY